MFPSQCTGCAAVSSVWRDSSQRDTPLCAGLRVLSQSSIFGQNPKIWCHEFNDLQTSKLSKKQLCDRTRPGAGDGTGSVEWGYFLLLQQELRRFECRKVHAPNTLEELMG